LGEEVHQAFLTSVVCTIHTSGCNLRQGLVLHGEADGVVPVRFGHAVFAAANQPKILRLFEGAGHVDLDDFGAVEATVEFVRETLEAATAPSSPPE
jgi:hypothetical protein